MAEGKWPHKAHWDALEKARRRDASYILDYGWTRPNVISRGPVAQQYGEAAALNSPLEQTIDNAPEAEPAETGSVLELQSPEPVDTVESLPVEMEITPAADAGTQLQPIPAAPSANAPSTNDRSAQVTPAAPLQLSAPVRQAVFTPTNR